MATNSTKKVRCRPARWSQETGVAIGHTSIAAVTYGVETLRLEPVKKLIRQKSTAYVTKKIAIESDLSDFPEGPREFSSTAKGRF